MCFEIVTLIIITLYICWGPSLKSSSSRIGQPFRELANFYFNCWRIRELSGHIEKWPEVIGQSTKWNGAVNQSAKWHGVIEQFAKWLDTLSQSKKNVWSNFEGLYSFYLTNLNIVFINKICSFGNEPAQDFFFILFFLNLNALT